MGFMSKQTYVMIQEWFIVLAASTWCSWASALSRHGHMAQTSTSRKQLYAGQAVVKRNAHTINLQATHSTVNACGLIQLILSDYLCNNDTRAQILALIAIISYDLVPNSGSTLLPHTRGTFYFIECIIKKQKQNKQKNFHLLLWDES